MEPLKEMFNASFYTELAKEIAAIEPTFNSTGFVKRITGNIEELSLNQRMRNTSIILGEMLPRDYAISLNILKKVIPHTRRGYTNLLFPDFVSVHGKAQPELSLDALHYFTKFGSSEFAIREFLKIDFQKTIKRMYEWASDPDPHVRRLASEGSRPRLPWSFKLDEVISNPSLTAPILNQLKSDPELYVRKSVANHLNDIAKENPEYMLKLVAGWDIENQHTAWIIRHGCRSLIKRGHPGSLAVFKFEKSPKVEVKKLKLNASEIKIGSPLVFSFEIASEKKNKQKLVVDYLLHYRKKNGELSPKVFKLKELVLNGEAVCQISKSQVMRDFTTRKHHPGKHLLEIQVNGKIMASKSFTLVK
jgi:3-methyladenine DNA glycosylase AlkC